MYHFGNLKYAVLDWKSVFCTLYKFMIWYYTKLFIAIPHFILEHEICMKCFLSHGLYKEKNQ